MHLITSVWPWYVSGPLISFIMFILIWFGKSFGVSSNLRTLCTIAGAGKYSDFFKLDWKKSSWNLVMAAGVIVGAFISQYFLSNDEPMQLGATTLGLLNDLKIDPPSTNEIAPSQLFGLDVLLHFKSLIYLVVGGFLVGFGTRYAGGCTSGHAISGLSNLQWPSLIAVIGFFIGGLLMTHIFLPSILRFLAI